MQQFGASMFHKVMQWHKSGEVENECNLHNFIVLPIFVLKLLKVVEIWQSYGKNNFDCFFWDTVYNHVNANEWHNLNNS